MNVGFVNGGPVSSSSAPASQPVNSSVGDIYIPAGGSNPRNWSVSVHSFSISRFTNITSNS